MVFKNRSAHSYVSLSPSSKPTFCFHPRTSSASEQSAARPKSPVGFVKSYFFSIFLPDISITASAISFIVVLVLLPICIGPLLILRNWPWLVKDALWIHFIDNNGALGSLVRGSASVHEQDIIIGETWSRIAALQVLPWFDRVDGASNPVDGLSRKNFKGVWQWREIYFPGSLRTALEAVVSCRLSGPKIR